MQVILRNAVDKLGHPGDIVSVSPGFARNYLIPRGFAFEATEGNRKRIALEKGRLEAAENERRQAAEEVATKLGEVSVTFAARVGEDLHPLPHAHRDPHHRRGCRGKPDHSIR